MSELISLIEEIGDLETLDEIIYESNTIFEFIQGMKAELEYRDRMMI